MERPRPPRRHGASPTSSTSWSGSNSPIDSSRRPSVRAADTYDYAVVRVVPRVEREEFVNVGIVLSCPAARFLQARIELGEARLLALDPGIDLELVRRHLASFPAICAGAP